MRNAKHVRVAPPQERGATMLEFLVMIPLFLLFLFILIDLARYFSTQIILTHGAQVGLRSAQCRDALEFDPFLYGEEQYRAMRTARKEIAEEATALPLMLLKWVIGGKESKRLQYFRHVTADADVKEPSELLPALVLLPGESAMMLSPEADKDKLVASKAPWYNHPVFCARQSPTCMPKFKRKDSHADDGAHSIVQLLKAYPIIVELRSEFHFLIPGFPTLFLKGRAVGYRERYPRFPDENL